MPERDSKHLTKEIIAHSATEAADAVKARAVKVISTQLCSISADMSLPSPAVQPGDHQVQLAHWIFVIIARPPVCDTTVFGPKVQHECRVILLA
jgi:hypothetical protein